MLSDGSGRSCGRAFAASLPRAPELYKNSLQLHVVDTSRLFYDKSTRHKATGQLTINIIIGTGMIAVVCSGLTCTGGVLPVTETKGAAVGIIRSTDQIFVPC